MLVDEDIKKIVDAHREVFATKLDFSAFQEEMRKNFSDLQTSVDTYAKKADTYFQEMVLLSHKVDQLEKWIRELAAKVGMQLNS